MMAAAALTIVAMACSCGKDKGESADKDKDTTETTKADKTITEQITEIFDKAVADSKANPENAEAIFEEANTKCDALTKNLSKEEQQKLMEDPKFIAALEKFMQAAIEMSQAAQPQTEAEMPEMTEPAEVAAEPATPAL